MPSITIRSEDHLSGNDTEARVASIASKLENFAFEGDVWSETLAELRSLLGTDAALAYLPARGPTHWTFEFERVALRAPEYERVYRLFAGFVGGQPSNRRSWAAYDPVHPEPAQRNRALHTSDLRRPGRLAHLYERMGAPELSPDQVRVLICDGPRLLGWVGVVSYRPVAIEVRQVLQGLVPALRTRLAFDELLRDRELAQASLGAAGRRLGIPDARYELRPVVVRGLPKSTLVTIRTETAPASSRLVQAGACWRLTPRQLEVLELVIAGLSNKQIALRLGVVEGTIELHLTAVFKKARVDSRAELTAAFWTGP